MWIQNYHISKEDLETIRPEYVFLFDNIYLGTASFARTQGKAGASIGELLWPQWTVQTFLAGLLVNLVYLACRWVGGVIARNKIRFRIDNYRETNKILLKFPPGTFRVG